METGDDSVSHLIDNRSDNSINANSLIEEGTSNINNISAGSEINTIPKNTEHDLILDLYQHGNEIQKSNSVADEMNCDTSVSDYDKKTNLNNSDLAIGFVDDDDDDDENGAASCNKINKVDATTQNNEING